MAWPPGGSLGQDVAKSKNLARSPCVGAFGWLFGSIVFIQGGSFMQGFCCVFFDQQTFPGVKGKHDPWVLTKTWVLMICDLDVIPGGFTNNKQRFEMRDGE